MKSLKVNDQIWHAAKLQAVKEKIALQDLTEIALKRYINRSKEVTFRGETISLDTAMNMLSYQDEELAQEIIEAIAQISPTEAERAKEMRRIQREMQTFQSKKMEDE